MFCWQKETNKKGDRKKDSYIIVGPGGGACQCIELTVTVIKRKGRRVSPRGLGIRQKEEHRSKPGSKKLMLVLDNRRINLGSSKEELKKLFV